MTSVIALPIFPVCRQSPHLGKTAATRLHFGASPAAIGPICERGPCSTTIQIKLEVFGNLQPARIEYPKPGIVVARDVSLVGFRTLLTSDGRFFCDEVLSTAASRSLHLERMADTDVYRNERTGLVRIGSTDQFAHRISKQPTHTCEEPVVIGCSNEPTNYGSFLFRTMPKILAARHLDPAHKFLVPLKYNSFRELCLLAGLSEDRLIAHDDRAIYKLRKAYLPTIRNPHAFLDEPTLGLFSRIAERLDYPNVSSRIFVSRERLASTKSGYRRMLNAGEVEERLVKLGFEIIYPEEMSIEEQIKKFRSAAIVVGQSGGAMFNVVFCRPGTHVVDIESEPHWIHAHMCLFSSLNLPYTIFEAKIAGDQERTAHRSLTVNADALCERIGSILTLIDGQA